MKRLVLLLLLPCLAHAEVSPITKYLTSERASLLDIGMMRLDRLTRDFEARNGVYWTENGNVKFFRPSISTSYEASEDKIYIYFFTMDSTPTEAQMTEGCEYAFGQMRIWLMKSLPDLFLHAGFDDPAVPADTREALGRMIELQCYFSSSRDSAEGRFWAHMNSMDEKMTVGKW